MVESMVRAAGYTTGLYTSPHLHRFPERIQVSSPRESQPSTAPSVEPAPSTPAAGPSTSPAPKSERGPGGEAALLPITRQEFAEGIEEVAAAIERVNAAMPDRRLLTFDALTALGFWAFRRHDVQVQVIEVGLGGLLDSTNVFQPEGDSSLVTVITNIGLEHREILGDTVPEIARQKAGIIVKGSPVIMAPQRESAADVIREVAAAKGAHLTEVALACAMRRDQAGSEHQAFRLRTPKGGYTVKLPLLGKHQLDNAATAVLAVEALGAAGIQVDAEAVQKGLESVRWPGRIEVLKRRPYLIVDSAHTADSARRLRDTLEEYLRVSQATLVVGVMGDKDLEGLMMAVEPVARRVIATQADHPRALAAEQVARVFRERSIETYVEPKLGAAIDMAMSLSTGSDAVVILGSIALAGEARAHVLGLERDPPVDA